MTITNFIDQLKESERVWFYGFTKQLNHDQLLDLKNLLSAFTEQWKSHGKQVKGKGMLIDDTLIAITVDNGFMEASGCSIDSSVQVIKEITEKYSLDTFDRLKIGVLQSGKIKYLRENQVKVQLKEEGLSLHSLYLDETVVMGSRKKELLKPIADSWMLKRMSIG